jgi:hypothetical protein
LLAGAAVLPEEFATRGLVDGLDAELPPIGRSCTVERRDGVDGVTCGPERREDPDGGLLDGFED